MAGSPSCFWGQETSKMATAAEYMEPQSAALPGRYQDLVGAVITKAIGNMRAGMKDLRTLAGRWYTDSNYTKGLDTLDNIIKRLDGPSRIEVLNGQMPIEKWIAGSNEVFKGMQAQAIYMKQNTWVTQFAMAAAEAAGELYQISKELAQFAKKTVGDVTGNLPWIAIGIVGVAAIMVMPQLKMLMDTANVAARSTLKGLPARRAAKRKKRG